MTDGDDTSKEQKTNDNPPPQANANTPTVAGLQAQLEEANKRTQDATTAALSATRDSLKAANPNLPDAAFAGDTIEAVTNSVTAHAETAAAATTKAETDAKARAAREIAHDIRTRLAAFFVRQGGGEEGR